ncbi:hypothetical protein [Ferrovum myxofaciens]|uniref:hypothetical protein n=1 Tax=Ferrovum myxofaciens TaxID=416213 RepID=UPI003EBE5A95
MIIFTIHPPSSSHLLHVIEEMKRLGPPKIKVVDCTDYLIAIEGTHRIEAARILGLAPELEILSQDDEVVVSDMDICDMFPNGTHIMPAGEVAAECYSGLCSGRYLVKDDGKLFLVSRAI